MASTADKIQLDPVSYHLLFFNIVVSNLIV